MKSTSIERSRALLRSIGARITHSRVQVLAMLIDADQPLTHHEVQQRLGGAAASASFDRVTLYRVLEWLTEQQLAHRVSSDDRVFRFSAHGEPHGAHGHFKCTHCDRMFCMPEGPGLTQAIQPLLPDGFATRRVDLTVLGVCAHCGPCG